MKLRTSSCKLTLFKKDVTRFAPVWIIYTVGMVMVLLSSFNGYEPDYAAKHFSAIFSVFGIVNLLYAAVVAGLLFGDLFVSRMCYSLHALPQRRESWFVCHAVAGLCFSLIPNLITALLMMTQLEEFWFVALYWLLLMTLQYLFFFGVAVFSIMLTGNRVGALAIYAVLNFFSMLAYGFCVIIYEPQMPGVVINPYLFAKLCPVVNQFAFDQFLVFANEDIFVEEWSYYDTVYTYSGLGEGWGYAALIAVIGLGLLGAAVLLYRRRDLECAGDFVAFRKLAPVVCVILTLCVGLVCAFMGELLSTYIVWLPVGIVIGYFGSLMLLERRLKVFRKKTFIGLGAIVAVLAVSLLVINTDALGIVTWLPETSQVKSVTIANYNSDNYHYDYYYGNRMSVTLTQEEEIAEIIEAHEDILSTLDHSAANTHYVVLEYTLKSGRTVKRAYSAPITGKNYQIIAKYFYTPEQILGYTDWETYKNNVYSIWTDSGTVPTAFYEELLEALKADCMEGYVVIDNYSDIAYWVDIEVENPNGSWTYRNLAVKNGAKNTCALLESPEIVLGYTDWEAFLSSVSNVYVDGNEYSSQLISGLLEAMRQDCEDGNINGSSKYVGALYYITFEGEYSDSGYFYRDIPITADAENTQNYLAEHGGY